MKKIFIIVNSPLFVIQHLIPIINKLKENHIVYLLYKEDKNYKINLIGVNSIQVPIKRNPGFEDLLHYINLHENIDEARYKYFIYSKSRPFNAIKFLQRENLPLLYRAKVGKFKKLKLFSKIY